MKKTIISFAVITVTILSSVIICSAKTSLTHFNTVVLDSQSETSRDAVLTDVIAQSKENAPEAGTRVDFPVSAEFQGNTTNLKDIMKSSSNSFFQK